MCPGSSRNRSGGGRQEAAVRGEGGGQSSCPASWVPGQLAEQDVHGLAPGTGRSEAAPSDEVPTGQVEDSVVVQAAADQFDDRPHARALGEDFLLEPGRLGEEIRQEVRKEAQGRFGVGLALPQPARQVPHNRRLAARGEQAHHGGADGALDQQARFTAGPLGDP